VISKEAWRAYRYALQNIPSGIHVGPEAFEKGNPTGIALGQQATGYAIEALKQKPLYLGTNDDK
jgi:hypothetical protein